MARIAVGGFQQETNTFAPQRATWADFGRADAWTGFVRRARLIDAVHGYNTWFGVTLRGCSGIKPAMPALAVSARDRWKGGRRRWKCTDLSRRAWRFSCR
jgi:hypothetical protein